MFLRTCRATLFALTAADIAEALSLLRQQREESNSSRIQHSDALRKWSSASSVSAGYSRGCYGAAGDPKSAEILRSFQPITMGEESWVNLPPPKKAKAAAPDSNGLKGRNMGRPDTDESSSEPKLALMMMVKDEVLNENIWRSWMDQAKDDGLEFSMVLHTSQLRRNETLGELFEPFRIRNNVATSWCDLWDAEAFLMEHALEDDSVTHLVTVSGDSVPLKPLRQIYEELSNKPQTRMCMDWHNEELPRAEAWWSMSRDDAELFVNHLQLARDTFRLEHVGKCTEEIGWAYPLILRQSRWPDEEKMLDQCVMFTDWLSSSSTCKKAFAWADHAALCDCDHLRATPHVDSTGLHPRTYSSVDDKAWQELRRSPFWFGRKFGKDAFATISETWDASDDPQAGQRQH